LLVRLLVAALLGGLFWLLAREELREAYGPDTATQIGEAFNKLSREEAQDCVIMGSSRMYRGVNPEKLSGRVFNFAHDGDGWNHIFYKLNYLVAHGKKPGRVVAGLDYFGFATIDPTRRFLYAPYFPAEFARDYDDMDSKDPHWGGRLNNEANLWMSRKISLICPALLKALLAPPGSLCCSVTSRGQYILPSRPEPYSLSPYQPLRMASGHSDKMNLYFDRVVQLCRESSVQLVLVMPPATIYEQAAYSPAAKAEFWAYLHDHAVGARLLNFETDRAFTPSDFSDALHLNAKGADRFSEMLGASLRK
jgi:hypothetical protein